jgi:hypothetical protein
MDISLVRPEQAEERAALERILDRAKTFYADPKNVQAFEAWKKNKEENLHGTANHAYA